MIIVARDQIVVGDRQRKTIPTATLVSLRESILARGNLHPPGVKLEADGKYSLVYGERRLRAIDQIAGDKRQYRCGSETIEPGFVAVLPVSELAQTPEGLLLAEYEENEERVPLDWQDKVKALDAIHRIRKEANPKQTFVETARELHEKLPEDKPGASVENLKKEVRRATLLVGHLGNEKISKARNEREAFMMLAKMNEEKTLAAIARRTSKLVVQSSDIELQNADCIEYLPTLQAGFVDLILTDPPYGINAGSSGFRGRTVHHHNYRDDVDTSRAIMQCILAEGFRITKNVANILMFTDIQHWDWLQNASANLGWEPFRRPIIWGKSDSEGLAPWGSNGPRITTEFIFFARKGKRGMISSPIDYWRVNRVKKDERTHAAEKPVDLLKKAIEHCTLPGELVLDPCCGSGSTLIAAREMKRRALGIEKDTEYYNTALANLYKKEQSDVEEAIG